MIQTQSVTAYRFAHIRLSVCLSVCTYIHTKVKKTPPTLKNDYYQTSTDGRPKCVFGQEANIFISGQYLLDYGPWLVFTIHVYSYSGTSFASNSSYTNTWIIIKLLQMVTLIRSCARSKAFDIGSVFTRLCPWLVFTIYTCNWKSIVWPTSRPLSQLCAHWCRVDKSS